MHLRAALPSSSQYFRGPSFLLSCASSHFSYILVTPNAWSQIGCHQLPGTGASLFTSLFPSVFTGPELAEGNSRSTWVHICDQRCCCCSGAQPRLTLCDHGPQHTGFPCPSLSPILCSNSCSLSWWRHPTISSSVAPFSLLSSIFPASGSFLMSRLFVSGGQSIGVSASVLDWRSYLKIRSVQKKIYLRDEEREREGRIQSPKDIDWAAGSNCTWKHILDFSLMSASKFLADSLEFLFVLLAW